MALSIKNWTKFQHFKNRLPPWIKLYRDLLDDPDWHDLTGDEAKMLVMLWLLASETKDGSLPCLKKIAFRFRKPEKTISIMLSRLSHWLSQDDANLSSNGHHVDAPELETETEGEGETETDVRGFEAFYTAYPKHIGKKEALKVWKKLRPNMTLLATMLESIKIWRASDQWTKEGGQFIPQPATWLNQGRWEDEVPHIVVQAAKKGSGLKDWTKGRPDP